MKHVTQRVDHRMSNLFPHPQRSGDRATDKRSVGNWGKIYEPDSLGVSLAQFGGDSECETRFANTAGASDGHQASLRDQALELDHVLVAANEATELRGQLDPSQASREHLEPTWPSVLSR